MSGLDGAPGDSSGVEDSAGRYLSYLIFGGLAILLAAVVALCLIVVIGVTSLSPGEQDAGASAERAAELRKLPDYWKVRRGDTYTRIARETGLTVDELRTFNPRVDPASIQTGQRLKLRKNVAKPKPRPLGPKWVTLRAGDSFGSIAAKTGKSITRLQELNPKLKPSRLQPGDRVRLR